jgi:hypothetical protein
MGITIHYRGQLKPKEAVRNVYIMAKLAAQERSWTITDFFAGEGALKFAKHPGRKDYQGPIQSFTILPHEHCEPVCFRFTADGYFEERCKTQFAPLEVHEGVVAVLDAIKSRLSLLVVEDEGHFWETRKRENLERNVVRCFQEMIAEKERDPDLYGPVKDEEGRITDLVKD